MQPKSQLYTSLLQSIQHETSSLKFQLILTQLIQNHVFKYSTECIQEMGKSLSHELDLFIVGCYRMVIGKLVYDDLVRKRSNQSLVQAEYQLNGYSKMMENIDEYTNKKSKQIKGNYCSLIQQVVSHKCKYLQFILFLIYFLTKPIISLLCHSSPPITHQFQTLLLTKHADQFATNACTTINYQLTGITVQKNVYHLLKIKYYQGKNIKVIKRRNNFISEVQKSELPFKFFLPLKLVKEKNSNDILTHQGLRNKQQIQLCRQLRNIFIKEEQPEIYKKRKYKNNNKYPQYRKTTNDHITFTQNNPIPTTELSNRPTKICRNLTARTSEAFTHHSIQSCSVSERNNYKKSQMKRNRYAQKERWVKERKNTIKDVNYQLISSRLSTSVRTQKKIKNLQYTQQPLIDWKKKVHEMAQHKFQKVTLSSSRDHQRGFSQNYYYKQIEKEKCTILQMNSTRNSPNAKENTERITFCEFSNSQSPHQWSTIKQTNNNFISQIKENQHKENRKTIKKQYSQFMKRIQQTNNNFSKFNEQINYMHRLEKALSKTNRLF